MVRGEKGSFLSVLPQQSILRFSDGERRGVQVLGKRERGSRSAPRGDVDIV